MSYLTAVFMGILQGVAEFLPISSSGHLALFQMFFGLENPEENHLFFTVLLHLGTLIAVCIVYWRDIVGMLSEVVSLFGARGRGSRELPPSGRPAGRRMILLLIIGTLPLFLVLPFKSRVEELFQSTLFVSLALIVTGCILFLCDRAARGRKREQSATITDALLVGVSQAVAVVPGLSRSGTTISAGMLRGFDREFAVRFSFLLSLPAVIGATILELIDAIQTGIDTALLPQYILGVTVSAVVGYFAIKFVRFLTDKGKFGVFAYYCWAVGVISLIASFIL